MVSHYNYLFVTFSLYSVFNEHLPSRFRSQQHPQGVLGRHLAVLGRPLLESRSALAAYPLRESTPHNVLHLAVLGRPKWTRTTDLVLIRHAL